MNFFKEQELARKRFEKLNILFLVTVYLTAFFTAIVLTAYFDKKLNIEGIKDLSLFRSKLYWFDFSFVALFIFINSWWKRWKLSKGGEVIALAVGGVELTDVDDQPGLKILENVVEEMSIAAGIIPPRIFILPQEQAINAFAAGLTMQDAVIGVSMGCLRKLNRDELQGVVAHEIGHIVNGDMKLNIELIGRLHGLMGIAHLGRSFLSGKKSKSHPIGFVIFAIGLFGYFLGLLLKHAISRGQEFAADARAVQFTRNPNGIGGALKKILSEVQDFKIDSSQAAEVDHLWFYYPRSILFSTHPPLEKRIAKILPTFKLRDFKKIEKATTIEKMNSNNSDSILNHFQDISVMPEIYDQKVKQIENQAIVFFRAISSHNKSSPEFNNEFIKEMNLILGRLRNLKTSNIKEILEKLKEVVKADGKLSPRELLCFALFKETLLPRTPSLKRDLNLKSIETEVIMILSFLSKVSSDSPNQQKESFQAGSHAIFDRLDKMINSQITTQELTKAFEKCRDLAPLEKEKLLKGIQLAIETQKNFSFNSELVKKVLAQIMGVPHTEV